jgi:hypothetical protein
MASSRDKLSKGSGTGEPWNLQWIMNMHAMHINETAIMLRIVASLINFGDTMKLIFGGGQVVTV